MEDRNNIPDAVYRESVARLRQMSQSERVQRLKDIGILTDDGRLSSRYGGEERSAAPSRSRATS